MTGLLETKSCRACAKAKRKCGKQVPRCFRCRKRGADCIYPPSKPSSFVLCQGEDKSSHHCDIHSYSTDVFSYCPTTLTAEAIKAKEFELGAHDFSASLFYEHSVSSWFTSSKTWDIVRISPAEYVTLSVADLKHHIAQIRNWCTRWVESGSNHFIHRELYRNHYPRSIQDAYTTLSCYINKTSTNEQIILQTIEERAKQLLVDNGISPDSPYGKLTDNLLQLDVFDHLSRVHSLMIYQLLGLYDGDIRLRSLSESRIPVLDHWMRQMVEKAKQTACLGDFLVLPKNQRTDISLAVLDVIHSQDRLWYSWILAESIRRTWIVGCSIQALYYSLYSGMTLPCQGGMMFTTRKGAWEAQSSLAWERMCLEVPLGLMQMAEFEKLFFENKPGDVDDFVKVFLRVMFGEERMREWGDKEGHS